MQDKEEKDEKDKEKGSTGDATTVTCAKSGGWGVGVTNDRQRIGRNHPVTRSRGREGRGPPLIRTLSLAEL